MNENKYEIYMGLYKALLIVVPDWLVNLVIHIQWSFNSHGQYYLVCGYF